MDFPLQLIPNKKEELGQYLPGIGSNLEFSYSLQELRNDLYLLLKTLLGGFLQDMNLGTTAVPHQIEDIYLESAVSRCCEQIRGCSCEAVNVVDGYLVVRVIYMGRIADFQFSVTAL